MQIILRFLLLVFASTSAVEGAEPYTPSHPNPLLEPWRWRSFPQIRGRELQCMAEDLDGNIWFGTEEGVWRYDGIGWFEYGPDQGLDGKPIVAIVVSSSNVVSCATTLGFYTLSEERWTRRFPSDGDMNWFVRSLAIGNDGSLWAATTWGLLHVEDHTQTLYCLEGVARHLRKTTPFVEYVPVPADLAATETVVYGELGIERIGDTVLWVISGSPADSANIHVGDRILTTDSTGSHRRLTIVRQGLEEPIVVDIYPRQDQGDLRHFSFHDLILSRENTVWLATSPGEIIRFDPASGLWRRYTDEDGLTIGGLVTLMEARNGSIWAVSDDRDGGINRFNGQIWTSFRLSTEGGIDLNPSILEANDGTIWVGGHEGILHAYRRDRWEIYRSSKVPVPTTRIIDLLESSDGALWMVGRGQEPIRFDFGSRRWLLTCENLNFACEDLEGGKWFLEVSGKVVRKKDETWTRFDSRDGLMDTPTGIIATRDGSVLCVGSHAQAAASARFDQGNWHLRTFPSLSWGIDGRAAFEAKDGAVWMGAAVDWDMRLGHRGGVLQVSGETVRHHRPPDVLRYIYGIGQTADDHIWIGSRRGLHHFDGTSWKQVYTPETLRSRIDAVHSSNRGDLWLGHRSRGIFHHTPSGWDQMDAGHGLADNAVREILVSSDGSVWAVSDRGTSRFDGQTWTPALPSHLQLGPRGTLRETRDGSLWINTASETWHRRAWPFNRSTREQAEIFKTILHKPDPNPPETNIAFAQQEVSQPGNTTISWTGADPWGETKRADLLFSWRLDDQTWSPYSPETSHLFQALASGPHRFEVRARDRDFNVDLTPASITFSVTPPVWRQT